MISKEEYMNSNYHNRKQYVIPLLDIKLDKINYFTQGKLDYVKLYEHVERIYDENKDKFI